ncbi:MAG TPA: hypothetical protein VIO16_09005, partial [Dehalococcoidia bacterium]
PTTISDSLIAAATPEPTVSGAAPGDQRITEPAEDPTITPDSVYVFCLTACGLKLLDHPLTRRV